MTDPVAHHPPTDPRIGLMHAAAEQLIPLFQTADTDESLARQMAISAIVAYHPGSRADCVNIARTIAFSMAALAVLGKAASNGMPVAEQMRAYGRANALNRSADQSERTMMQRRRFHLTAPPAELPAWMDSASETSNSAAAPPETPVSDATMDDDAIVQAAIAEAMHAFNAHRSAFANEPTSPDSAAPPSDAAQKPAASRPEPVVNSGQRPVTAALPAIRCSDPNGDTHQPGTASLKSDLLRRTAMPRAAVQSVAPHPT